MSAPVPKVIDTCEDVTSAAVALRSLGVETILGYLNPLGQTYKVVTPARARAIAKAGLRLGLISEGWGDFTHGSFTEVTGVRDAKNALKQAPLLGAPKGITVYFAVDTDATHGQLVVFLLDYFRSIRTTLAGMYNVGVYGSGAVCEALLDAKLADATMLAQSTGWLRSREFALTDRWTLKQLLPIRLAGVLCDPVEVQPGKSVGDFEPEIALSPASAPLVS